MPIDQSFFNLVNQWKGSKRIKTFIWKASHKCWKEQVGVGSKFYMYCMWGSWSFFFFHLFKDCGDSKMIWKFLICEERGIDFYFVNDWKSWLKLNLSNSRFFHVAPWSLVFGIILNFIYWRRNNIIFQGETWTTIDTIDYACRLVEEYTMNSPLYEPLAHSKILSYVSSISWLHPHPREVALSCDGDVTWKGTKATGGGVIWDHAGNFIYGYSS